MVKVRRRYLGAILAGVVLLLLISSLAIASGSRPSENREADAQIEAVLNKRPDGLGAIVSSSEILYEVATDRYVARLVSYTSAEGRCLDAFVSRAEGSDFLGSVGGCGFSDGASLAESWVVGTLDVAPDQTLGIALGSAPDTARAVIIGLADGTEVLAPVVHGGWVGLTMAPPNVTDGLSVFLEAAIVASDGNRLETVQLGS